MEPFRIEVSQTVINDVIHIHNQKLMLYGLKSAEKFLKQYSDALNTINTFPNSFRKVYEDKNIVLRRINFDNYYLIFHLSDKHIRVIGLFYSKTVNRY